MMDIDGQPTAAVKGSELPIHYGGHEELLCDHWGRPVWSVRTDSELEALEQVALAFGATLVEVEASGGRTTPGTGMVAAWGRETTTAGQLYAHLTARRFKEVRRVEELASLEALEVVVTTPSELSAEMLEDLYERAGLAPGIVFASDAESLREEVLVRTAAAKVCGRRRQRRLDILPSYAALELLENDDGVLLGGGASGEQIDRALSQEVGLLTVVSHSDGVDTFLGQHRVLCPLEGRSLTQGAPLAPRCQMTGVCHRANMSIDHARSEGRLVSPSALCAEVLLMKVCWGITPTNQVVGAHWTLGVQLARSPRLGVVITTWELAAVTSESTFYVRQLLDSGVCVGEAVREYNHSELGHRLGYKLALLGDPRVRLAKASVRPGREGNALPTTSNASASDSRGLSLSRAAAAPSEFGRRGMGAPRLLFLRACIEAAQPKIAGDLARLAERALRELRRCLMHGEQGDAGLSKALVEYFSRRTVPMGDWMSVAGAPQSDGAVTRCRMCTGPARTLYVPIRITGAGERRLVLCAVCGATEDCPSECRLEVEIDSTGRVQVNSLDQITAAAIGVHSSLPEDFTVQALAVPQVLSQPYVASFDGRWPSGPLRFGLVLAWGENIAIFGRRLRRPREGTT